MNHCVPDFEMEDTFPSLARKSSMQEDEVMELLWQDGQLVMQRQTKIPSFVSNGSSSLGVMEANTPPPQLFIQEDEMASWLHYPLDDDNDFCSDLLFTTPSAAATGSCTDTAVTDLVQPNRPPPPPKPPVPPTRRNDEDLQSHGFGHFSRFGSRQDASGVSETVVESNATPVKEAVRVGLMTGSSSVGVETNSLVTVDSSSGESGAEPGLRLPACGDKKRKAREADEIECHSQDVVPKATDTRKPIHGSTTKRTRAAEVHNLSERRRRDRINEKMKALQELIPRCNKSDKASMLDDAIEYLKSLQMQVQMMSMGGMVPMMFPGMQQYMPPMGMGIGMGMGMGIDMNRPMMPFPMATPAHMGPRFPVPSYHPIPPFLPPVSSRIQVNNQGSMSNPAGSQNTYQDQAQTLPDQYQQYLGSQILKIQPPQNNMMTLPSTSKPIRSGGPENLEPRPPPR